jgi:very-short-patch-repair endonuclease
MSKGEITIKKILEKNNIEYETQKIFKNCKYKSYLPFDFYLPIKKIAIEFDGIQHYQSVGFFGGTKELKKTQIKDNIKTEYCKNNNIELIRIKYNNLKLMLNKINLI